MEKNNLKERLARLSPAQREKLLQKLNVNLQPVSEKTLSDVPVVEHTEYPLSNDQQRMWMFEQIQGSGAAYNIVFALHMQGELEPDALEYAFTQLVNQHEILRTHFVEAGDAVRQKVNAPFKVDIQKIDGSHLDYEQDPGQIEALVYDLVDVKLDLATLPLFRATLIRLSETSNILVFVLHHILADGWSLGVIEQQISKNYVAWLKGQRKDVPPNPIQYRHYVSWQASWLKSDAASQQLDYWQQQLAGAPEYLPLPTLVDRSQDSSLNSSSYMFSLSEQQMDKLKALVVKENVSLFMAMMAAFKVVLGYFAGVEDLVVGSPVANRKQKQFDEVVGMFSNTVALRSKPELRSTFIDYLNTVRRTSLSAFSNQNIPFEQVVDAVCPTRSAAYSPLFQVLFALQVRESTDAELSGIDIEAIDLIRREIEFDLIFEFFDNGAENSGVLSYKTARYSEAMMQTLVTCFRQVLDLVLDKPDMLISEVVAQLGHQPVTGERLTQNMALLAENAAIEHNGQVLNYEQLLTRLPVITAGINKALEDATQPLCLVSQNELDYWLLVLASAVLEQKVLLIEPDTSVVACNQALALESPALVISRHNSALLAAQQKSAAPDFDAVDFETLSQPTESGQSTQSASGRLPLLHPKAIFVSAGLKTAQVVAERLNASLAFLQAESALDSADGVLLNPSVPFELRLISLFWPLMAGTRMVLPSAPQWQNEADVTALLTAHDASVVLLLPDQYRQLRQKGENVALSQYRRILVNGQVSNLNTNLNATHGMNEVGDKQQLIHIWSFPEAAGPVLIRKSDTEGNIVHGYQGQITCVNRLNQALPVGISGEIVVTLSGADRATFLATGVQGCITENSITTEGGVYRLGDRWINGHLVDPAVIEATLAAQPGIADVAILPRKDQQGTQHLVAYLVPDRKLTIASLRTRLQDELHAFEIPGHFVLVNQIPLTQQGDIDLSALRQTPTLERVLPSEGEEMTINLTWLDQAQEEIPVVPLLETQGHGASDSSNAPAVSGATIDEANQPDAITSGTAINHLSMPLTLVEMFKDTLKREDTRHITYLLDGDGNTLRQSYSELYDDACRILTGLQQAGLTPKDRVLLQISDNKTMLTGFWACVLGGMVPLALACPERYRSEDNETIKIIDVCDSLEISMVLASSGNAEALALLPELQTGNTKIQPVEAIQSLAPTENNYQPGPEDTALLLLTSGSTGKPKAVMQSHQALMSRSLATIVTCDFNTDVVSFNWMPLDHVGGLVMFHILDVYLGSHQIHCPTSLILDNPLRWLDWMSEYKVTTTWSPNFAYALVNEHLSADDNPLKQQSANWDLSHINCMINAGEAVVPKTAKEFIQHTAAFGLHGNAMKPVWGMSETCSGVTYHLPFAPLTEETDSTFVQVGKPIPGVSIRVVDAENRLVKEGTIGSLQITGPTITQGYLNNPQATAESFTEDGWFKTGDLARVEEGIVTITGREKDLIIINGKNYQGQEIEKLVEKLPDILPAHVVACGVRTADDNTDKLALFFSLQTQTSGDMEQLKQAMRQQVLNGVGLAPSYFIPFTPEQFPRTSIGKIQRSLLVKQFGEGMFNHLLTQHEHKVPAWFYEPCWISRKATGKVLNHNTSIVITGNTSAGIEMADTMRQQAGGQVIQLDFADDFKQLTSDRYQLQPDNKEQWQALFSQVQTSSSALHIVHCGACKTSLSEQQLLEDWQADLHSEFAGLLALSQAITSLQEAFRSIQLDVISQNAFAVNEQEVIAPEKGLLQGFIRSLPQEIPGLQCRQIDIDKTPVAEVVKEVLDHSNDDQVALRQNNRFVARLKPATLPMVPVKPKVFSADKFYIVTGGIGGIGAKLTDALLTSDKVNVLVLGRTPINTLQEKAQGSGKDDINLQEKLNALSRFNERNDAFAYEAVDVCDPLALKRVIAQYEEVWQKSPGAVFHLAGDSRDVEIARESLEPMLASMQAKVAGACAIYQALQDREEVEQIHFGSVNGHFGGYGHAAYSAANSFLNAWCQNLYRQGKPLYCYQWSMWDELGLSRGYQLKRQTEAKGFRILAAKQGLMSLRVAMASPTGSMLIGLDGTNLNIEHQITSPYRTLQALQVDSSEQQQLPVKDQFGAKLNYVASIDGNIRQQNRLRELSETEQCIAAIWQDILKLNGKVSASDDFFELGGNSLQITRLSSALAEKFNLDISMHLLFEHSSLAALADYLEQQAPTQNAAIEVIPRDGSLPLSFAQQRFWYIDQLQGSSVEYNIPVAMKLSGSLNKQAFQAALDEIVARHEVLRTTFHDDNGDAAQIIHPATSVAIAEVDLSQSAQPAQRQQIEQLTTEEVFKPFDLSEDLMLRAMLIRLSDNEHVLLFTMHHIASDGWSMNLLTGEFIALYEAFIQGKASPLAAINIQYVDYGHWQQEMLQSEHWAKQLDYWKNKLADLPELHNLPLDAPRPPEQNFQADRLIQEIQPALLQKLKTLAKEQDATLFMLLQSAFALLLARWSNSSDIVMGVPVAGRDRSEVENLIGCFINTLVFRTDLSGNPGFVELLQQAKTTALEAFSNQNVPFELLVEELNPKRQLAYNPVCQIKFVLQNHEQQELILTDLAVTPIDNGYDQLHFDLDLTAFDTQDGLFFHWGFKQDLFRQETISRMADSFAALLEHIVTAPQTSVQQLNLLPQEQEQQLLSHCHGRFAEDNRATCLHQAFEQQLTAFAEQTAVAFGDTTLSYQQLNAKANRLAHYLQQHNVGAGQFVGIYTERSVELIIAMLAVLKSGAAYIPVEPKNTPERLKSIVEDSDMQIILAHRSFGQNLPEDIKTLWLEEVQEVHWLSEYSDSNLALPVDLDDTAYVIYTSGSTGKPKGVEISHRGLMDYCAFALDYYYPANLSGSMVATSHGFDLALPGFYLPLLAGHQVNLPTPGEEIPELAKHLSQSESAGYLVRFTPMHVQGLLDQLENQPISGAAHVFVVGGDVFPVDTARALQQQFPASQIYNHYGPTETVVGCAIYNVTANIDELQHVIPVGTAMHNSALYVLNDAMRPCPVNVPGELYVVGTGVAKGYLNQPGLTAEKFVANPFGDVATRLYKTGDIVRYLPDENGQPGNIEFMGRKDDQVKIRGYRIEPGEIASKLSQLEGVKEALVMADGEAEYKKLIAWVIPKNSENQDEQGFGDELLTQLAQCLPDYMVPSDLLLLTEMPLTANGKIDKKALPRPAALADNDFSAPTTGTEKQLAEIWSEILKVALSDISRTADFYELGGQSLLAIRLVANIRSRLESEVTVTNIFEYRILAELAEFIDKQKLESTLRYDDSEALADDEMELTI